MSHAPETRSQHGDPEPREDVQPDTPEDPAEKPNPGDPGPPIPEPRTPVDPTDDPRFPPTELPERGV